MSKDLLNSIKEEIYKEEIKKIAYYLWQEAGCPENKDLEFWLLAEKKYELLSTFEDKSIPDRINPSFLIEEDPPMVGNNRPYTSKGITAKSWIQHK